MSENWKPGDVAMVTAQPFTGMKRTERAWVGPGECWHFDDGAAIHVSRADMIESARRLVVIDPEDREATDRLVHLLVQHGWKPPMTDGCRDALREFANPTPPKPEEPTGLGAVVEAVCGCNVEAQTFVRNERVDPNDPWEALCGWHVWPDLQTVVRVLSEGVTP